jgi:hypothetical protein
VLFTGEVTGNDEVEDVAAGRFGTAGEVASVRQNPLESNSPQRLAIQGISVGKGLNTGEVGGVFGVG